MATVRFITFSFFAISLFAILESCKDNIENVNNNEALSFAKELEQAVNNSDTSFLNNMLDLDLFAKKTIPLIKIRVDRTSLKKELSNSSTNSIGKEIELAVTKNHGSYEFVKQYSINGIRHIILRMYSSIGFNYHDFELIKKNNKIKITDLFNYISGDLMSEEVANLYNNGGSKNKLQSIYNITNQIKTQINNKDLVSAENSIKEIPKELRNNKQIRIFEIEVYYLEQNLRSLKDAVTSYNISYPNDPTISMLLLSYDFSSQNYKSALDDVNELDKKINTDPFLNYFRGKIYLKMDRIDSALIYFNRAETYLPKNEDIYTEIIIAYLKASEFNNAKSLVREYKKLFNPEGLNSIYTIYPEYKKVLEETTEPQKESRPKSI